MNILLTGSSCFVGFNLSKNLSSLVYKVIGIDKFNNKNK